MVSDRGAEPATLAPPDSPAIQAADERRRSANPFSRSMIYAVAETEVTRGLDGLALADGECDAGAAAEIDATFQRKLAAIRRLPKRDRPDARRAAIEERVMALIALRHKRETARQFRRYLRQLLTPKPQP